MLIVKSQKQIIHCYSPACFKPNIHPDHCLFIKVAFPTLNKMLPL